MRIGFTIILNGLHHLKHNNYAIDLLENHLDYWVVVEGASNNKGSTNWCKPMLNKYHSNGFSVDGTTEYLDMLNNKYDNLIYIKPKEVWESKDDMINTAIKKIRKLSKNCFLWEIDIDEQMTLNQRIDSEYELISKGGKTGQFLVNQYIDDNLIAEGEWVIPFNRLWDWKGEYFKSHEPPLLVGGNGREVLLNSIIEHYSFCYEQDVIFKNDWYGSYDGLYENWLKLKKEKKFPQNISKLFNDFPYKKTEIVKKKKISVENLFFYNHFHNGDVHYSQEFVKDICSQIDFKNCYYLHNNTSKLLKHIPYIKNLKINDNCIDKESIIKKNNDLYINTWMGQKEFKFYNMKQCSLYSNYELYKEIYNELGLTIKNIEYYIPTIDYTYYDIKNIDKYLRNNNRHKILISNGNVLSGQSNNFDFNPIIIQLANEFKDVDFILTNNNNNKIQHDNVLYTSDIIMSTENDLNEISYLSLFCDIIIGRCSGPYCFTQVKRNFYNNKKTFIGFCNSKWECEFYNSKTYNVFWYNEYNDVYNKIHNHINNILTKNHNVNLENNIKQICENTLMEHDIIIYYNNVEIYNSLTQSKDNIKFESDYVIINNEKYLYNGLRIKKIKE